MTREALADRLINYADAVAAFAVVNSLAFLVALAEREVRCSLIDRLSLVVGGQLALSFVVMASVLLLRRSELKVRASSAPLAAEVSSYLRGFFLVRIAVIALATVFTVSMAILALTDTSCPTPVAHRLAPAAAQGG